MRLQQITAFAFAPETASLSYEGKALPIAVLGAPVAQFRYGEHFLVMLPDDPYAGSLFSVLLLSADFAVLEQHSAPLMDEAFALPLEERIRSHADDALLLELAPTDRWLLKISSTARVRPFEALARMTRGWLPLFEYPLLVRASFLSIRPAPAL